MADLTAATCTIRREDVGMERYRALLKETWWLWLLLVGFGVGMSFLSAVFLVTLPISICTFLWFAYVRYDEDGKFKGS